VTDEKPIESLGGNVGERPLTVGLIAVTRFKPTAQWAPRRCSEGEGALALLSHTVPARSRPEPALHAVRRAATGALVLEGDRGEAADAAAALLAVLDEGEN
jgi:hypothetical protein